MESCGSVLVMATYLNKTLQQKNNKLKAPENSEHRNRHSLRVIESLESRNYPTRGSVARKCKLETVSVNPKYVQVQCSLKL